MTGLRSLATGLLAAVLVAAHASAAPLTYRVNMTAPANGHPILSGAGIEMTITWDPAGLTPLFDNGSLVDGTWTTTWSATNTVASMKITGTPAHNGIYPGAPSSITEGWFHYNNAPARGDALQFPRLDFPFDIGKISILGLEARFADTFNQSLSTIFPKPFSNSETTWVAPNFLTPNPASRDRATDLSGFAAVVPEPSSIVAACGALAGFVALRHSR